MASRSTNGRLLAALGVVFGKILRRIEWRLHSVQTRLLPDDPLTKRLELEAIRETQLRRFYDCVRAIGGSVEGMYDEHGVPLQPTVANIRKVEREALSCGAQATFVTSLIHNEPFDVAVVKAVRAMIAACTVRHARSLAQVLQSRPESASIGDIAMGLVVLSDQVPETSWALFQRVERDRVLRLVPHEYFRTAFMNDPAVAGQALRDALDGGTSLDANPAEWFAIARASFAAGFETESREALQRARVGAPAWNQEDLVERLDWLESWYGKADEAKRPVEAAAGTIPFAIIDYKQVDRERSSRNLGDHVQTIASMGHLVRHKGFRFSGDAEAVATADRLKKRVRPERVIEGDDAEFSLYRIGRDSTNYFAVPDGTWTIAFGWYMHSIFEMKYDAPFNPRLRPIFISFHINVPALLTGDVIEYLRKYAPIGCRDWNTVYLLQSAGVPAFFSGCLTTTTDTVFPPTSGARPKGTLFVDTKQTGPGDRFTQSFNEVRVRSFTDNIDEALDRLESYRSTYKQVATSRLHCYLPARSIGADVDFRPKNPADVRFDGLANIDDVAYDRIRSGILEKLDAMLTAIGDGKSEDDVYAVWREVCAADVAAAEVARICHEDIREPTFDVAEACRMVLKESVTIERSQPGLAGEEVNVEFSLDGNLKHQLCVVLDSIVTGASRPIRAYILCRDHDQADFERVSKAFPTVSFVWLPTDHVDYGEIVGMIAHITVATMDRLLLPELLLDVPRIIHHDLDALCFGDVSELYDLDLGGSPIAARTSPQPDFRSGFIGLIKAAKRLRNNQDLARELIVRSHTRHTYDFLGFNAGVMVLDLERMRVDEFCRHFLPYAERFGMNDQEVLNAYAGADRVELEADWNRLPRIEIVEHPKIVHWAGVQKPWDADYVQYKESWDEVDERVTARLAAIEAERVGSRSHE